VGGDELCPVWPNTRNIQNMQACTQGVVFPKNLAKQKHRDSGNNQGQLWSAGRCSAARNVEVVTAAEAAGMWPHGWPNVQKRDHLPVRTGCNQEWHVSARGSSRARLARWCSMHGRM
jgi:hypothetical protein